MALLDVRGFIREGGKMRPFEAYISDPIVALEGDAFCCVRIHPLLSTEKRIYGADGEQASKLAINFLERIVAGKDIVDSKQMKIEF
jgi:hypothetical protein